MKMNCDWCGKCVKCQEINNYTRKINREANEVKSKIVVHAFQEYHVKDQKMYISFQLETKNSRNHYGKVSLPYASVSALSQNHLIPIVKDYVKEGIMKI